MPIYTYRCEQCTEEFEVRASFAEKEAGLEAACPSCAGRRQVRQVITGGLLLRLDLASGAGPCECGSVGPSGCCS